MECKLTSETKVFTVTCLMVQVGLRLLSEDNPMPAQVAHRQNFPIYSIQTKQTCHEVVIRNVLKTHLTRQRHARVTYLYLYTSTKPVEVNIHILKPQCYSELHAPVDSPSRGIISLRVKDTFKGFYNVAPTIAKQMQIKLLTHNLHP
jgi:hypothetical protein